MKVLQINQVVRVTSTGRIVENLGNYLMEQGHESYIAYSGRPKNESNSILYQVSNSIDTNLHALNTRLFDRHGLYSKKVTKDFVKWIVQVDPDIIHLHNIHGYYLNYPILFEFLKLCKKPIFWTFHDFWPITGHCSHFININCEKWREQCQSCPKLKYYPASLILDNSRDNYNIKKRIFNSLDGLIVISISDWVKGLLQESFLSEKSIIRISNGINSSVFKPTSFMKSRILNKYGLEDKVFLIALATTWQKSKGYYDFLKLAESIPSKYQLILVGLVGKMAENLPQSIKAISRTYNQEDLVELYNLAEINLNLSYQETFGLTTVEALMCGVPSIVYNATASPELVTEETGIVVEPGDIAGVVDAINKIMSNGGKKFYAQKCREHALKYFDERIIYQKHLELYQNAL